MDVANISVDDGSPTTSGRARAEIDARISERDRLSLISRLPAEVLAKVFLCAQRDSDPRDPFGWIAECTHVCTHWREVAISYPRLWCSIFFTSFNTERDLFWLPIFLERAKGMDLSINIETSQQSPDISDEMLPSIRRLLRQPHRLKGLKVISHSFSIVTALDVLTAVSAPSLRSLVLHDTAMEYGGTSKWLPDDVLGEGTPELCHVDIDGWGFSWTWQRFANLTSLNLKIPWYIKYDTSFFQAMERMTTLIHLDLSVPSIAGRHEEVYSEPGQIGLPLLRTFRTKSSTKRGVGLLTPLCIPSTAQLHVTVCDFENDKISSNAMALSRAVGKPRLAPLSPSHPLLSYYKRLSIPIPPMGDSNLSPRRLRISPVKNRTGRRLTLLRITMWSVDHLDCEVVGLEEPPEETCLLDMEVRHGQTQPFLGPFLESYPLEHLREVILDCKMDKGDFGILGGLPSLETVRLTAKNAKPWFRYIVDDPALLSAGREASMEIDSDRPALAHFPSLVFVSFEAADFGLGRYAPANPDDTMDVEQLLDFLTLRHRLGGQIRTVQFTNCVNLFEADVEKMKGIGVQVVWDGHSVARDFSSSGDEESDEEYEEDSEDSSDSDY